MATVRAAQHSPHAHPGNGDNVPAGDEDGRVGRGAAILRAATSLGAGERG
jgi:hypothetical protein